MPEEEIEYTPEYPNGSSVEPYDIAREEELLLKEIILNDYYKNKK